jgi:hypothetical protein
MKKFDSVLREAYRLIAEQDMDPNAMDPAAALPQDLGAAMPTEEPVEAEPETEKLTSAAEVNLTKLLRYALFTCLPENESQELDDEIPEADDITNENSKEVLATITTVLQSKNPDMSVIDVSLKTDQATLEGLPPV